MQNLNTPLSMDSMHIDVPLTSKSSPPKAIKRAVEQTPVARVSCYGKLSLTPIKTFLDKAKKNE